MAKVLVLSFGFCLVVFSRDVWLCEMPGPGLCISPDHPQYCLLKKRLKMLKKVKK